MQSDLNQHSVKQHLHFPWLFCLSVWMLFCGLLGQNNIASIDLWGKIAIPAIWQATGVFPTHDYFSFTAHGAPWIDHEWLSGCVFYTALLLTGETGLTLLKWIVAGLMTWGVFNTTQKQNIPPIYPFLLLLAGLPFINIGFIATGRPQIFTFMGVALLLSQLETTRLTGKAGWLYWLFPLAIIWCNLHGGFAAGLLLLCLYALSETLQRHPSKPYWIGIALMAVAPFINPYGLAYPKFLWYALTLPRPEITEWHSVSLWDTHHLHFKLLAGVALTFLMICLVQGRWKKVLTPGLALSALILVGFQHVKHQPLSVIGIASLTPLLIHMLSEQLKPKVPTWLFSGLALGVLGGGACLLIQQSMLVNPLLIQVRHRGAYALKHTTPYPVEAIRFLKQSDYCGNLFVGFSWGEFAFWELYPQFHISIDGRLESVYSMDMFRKVERFYDLHHPNTQIPEQLKGQWLLLPKNYPALARLQQSPQWKLAYWDADYVILGNQQAFSHTTLHHLKQTSTHKSLYTVSDFFNPSENHARFALYNSAH